MLSSSSLMSRPFLLPSHFASRCHSVDFEFRISDFGLFFSQLCRISTKLAFISTPSNRTKLAKSESRFRNGIEIQIFVWDRKAPKKWAQRSSAWCGRAAATVLVKAVCRATLHRCCLHLVASTFEMCAGGSSRKFSERVGMTRAMPTTRRASKQSFTPTITTSTMPRVTSRRTPLRTRESMHMKSTSNPVAMRKVFQIDNIRQRHLRWTGA